MGHEYMEMKNTNAAIQCYRQAIGKTQLFCSFKINKKVEKFKIDELNILIMYFDIILYNDTYLYRYLAAE